MDNTTATKRTSQGSRRGVTTILAITAAGAILAGLFGSGTAVFYGFQPGATNQGFAIGDCWHFDMGVEWKGTPGFFVDQC